MEALARESRTPTVQSAPRRWGLRPRPRRARSGCETPWCWL